jgi:hypothetical protein
MVEWCASTSNSGLTDLNALKKLTITRASIG